jgi:hypothetical protein
METHQAAQQDNPQIWVLLAQEISTDLSQEIVTLTGLGLGVTERNWIS